MSLYQYELKREIKFYQNSILRYKNNIAFLKKQIEENNYYQAHISMIKDYSRTINKLNNKLQKLKRLIH